MSTLAIVALVYAICAVPFFVCGMATVYGAPNDRAKRDGARLALASPIWPYLLFCIILRKIVNLNRLADWKK